MPRILFVSGFHPATRARDLAYEFEKFGQLVRCDVPAPRNPHATHNPYAFVEFKYGRDAEDAYHDMHGKSFEGSRLSIQWAKSPPSSVWRYDRRSPPPVNRSTRRRSRSLSPPRRRDDRDRDREPGNRDRDRRRRSRTPERRRSPSPVRRRDDRDRDRDRNSDRNGDRARTPPPKDGLNGIRDRDDDRDRDYGKDRDRARTPPYDN